MCQVVNREFKVIGMKQNGPFESYAQLVPQAAQQFLQQMPNYEGTEVTVYEPKSSDSHVEGTFYVGILVEEKPVSLPEGIEFLEIQHTYGMISGKGNEMGKLYSTLDEWIYGQGYQKELDGNYIIETYHPIENDIEMVEIYIPINS
ncbi:GyrI-like domain-containing protein [Bacillus sp. ISL-35]|uniref:GyrI-like domain-containing protein n=1 Tax=Bacillus sp. ISL-35 TaxID=2819122 RepID=UPI001BEAD6F1|nr:GyrI-like domain-containing protein [Bacillus sp. ISL-35]MBT2680207.1 GyrI-like domain-containing protein [Bacillus sp. ISL-35]MBT2704483.1 GyrI-like domain-containing protein [Chryseobacterium sp. ISL-80]